MTNVFDYMHTKLRRVSADVSLRDLPLDSACGADCKRAIDAAKEFMNVHKQAFGRDDEFDARIFLMTENIVMCFWHG